MTTTVVFNDENWLRGQWWWKRWMRVTILVATTYKTVNCYCVTQADEWKDECMDEIDGSGREWMIKWMDGWCSMHEDERECWSNKGTHEQSIETMNGTIVITKRHNETTSNFERFVWGRFRTRFAPVILHRLEWMESATNSCQLRKQAWRTKWASSQLCNLLATASFGSNGKQAKKRCGHCNASKHFQLMQLCAKCQE